MKYKVGDRVCIIEANEDVRPWAGLVGVVIGICEDWDFPYEVEFEGGEEVEFKEEELEEVNDEI